MTHRNCSYLLVLLAGCLLAVVPLSGCSSRSTARGSLPSTLKVDTVTADTVRLCGFSPDPDGRLWPEIYSVTAMNNKLRHFPTFAGAIGMTSGSVTDCPSARSFYKSYFKYLRDHPDFDEREPIQVPPLPPFPEHVTSTLTVPKIFNGTPATNSPIVYISDPFNLSQAALSAFCVNGAFDQDFGFMAPCPMTPDGAIAIAFKSSSCTGTFISKNWIATAAHCMLESAAGIDTRSVDGWMPNSPDAPAHPTWIRFFDWTIKWADATGQVAPQGNGATLSTSALQIIDPDYVGFDPTTWFQAAEATTGPSIKTPHDFALLYLPPGENDGLLPPSPNGSPTGTGGAMAISLNPVDPAEQLTVWGYGSSSNSDPPGTPPVLRSAMIQPNTAHLVSNFVGVTTPTGGPQFGGFCKGDSGGPWTVTRTNIDGNAQQLIVGVTSNHFKADPMAPSTCPTNPGDVMYFVPISGELDLIQTVLANGSGHPRPFTCDAFSSAGNLANKPDYAQCWGFPCQSDCDCPIVDYCNNPVTWSTSAFQNGGKSCSVCTTLGDCSCIVGECLLRPDAIDFLEAGASCNANH